MNCSKLDFVIGVPEGVYVHLEVGRERIEGREKEKEKNN